MNEMRKLMEAVAPLFEDDEGAGALDRAKMVNIVRDAIKIAPPEWRSPDEGSEEGYEGHWAWDNTVFAMDDITGKDYSTDSEYERQVDQAIDLYKERTGRFVDGDEESGVSESVTEGNSDAEYELEEILNQLQELSDQAISIAKQYYPDLYRTYAAYDAFDFGGSSNPYDPTFAKFVKEAMEGDGEEDDPYSADEMNDDELSR